jgi:EAL domain-containing protein (putative c-di-GMP-specific phosphodiesterase class I)
MGAIRTARSRVDLGHARTELARLIACQRFGTVFQPIVRVDDHQIEGFEALTRFDNGRAPDRMFAWASQCGLSDRLETATLERALVAAKQLPPDAWLSVNMSAETLQRAGSVRELLAAAERPLVLELTEHEPIHDYTSVRSALRELAGVKLAVDDTGSGFASLRHVIELRPSFIKTDRLWVHGLAQDPCRQAIVRGLRTLAESTGAQVVAEGVERRCDLAALDTLGIPLAQGFLLGEPGRASEWS